MIDDKSQRDMLVQIGASAAAAAVAAVSLVRPAQPNRAAAAQDSRVNPRAPITVDVPGQLKDKQMLQVRVVNNADGLRVASSRIASLADELPSIGSTPDGTAVDVAIVREGDALRIYGLNAIGTQPNVGRCNIGQQEQQ